MGKYCATSDVKCIVGADLSPLSAGLTSNALPEVQKPIKPTNSQTGVSTNRVSQPKEEERIGMPCVPPMEENTKHTLLQEDSVTFLLQRQERKLR